MEAIGFGEQSPYPFDATDLDQLAEIVRIFADGHPKIVAVANPVLSTAANPERGYISAMRQRVAHANNALSGIAGQCIKPDVNDFGAANSLPGRFPITTYSIEAMGFPFHFGVQIT